MLMGKKKARESVHPVIVDLTAEVNKLKRAVKLAHKERDAYREELEKAQDQLRWYKQRSGVV